MVALVLFAVARDGWCPCVVVGPPGGDFGSVGQQAIFVVQNGAAARYRVVLVPRIQVNGNPDDVGILVPTPSVPVFQTVGARVFNEGARVTAPLQRRRSSRGSSSGCGFAQFDDDAGDALSVADDGATVISQQTVGDFDVVVLSATTASALTEWLDENGYAHGVDDDSVLNEYVANGWVFTAMRRRVQEGDEKGRRFLWNTEPIAMSYDADELRYPMRLAALSASTTDATKVLIYTIADERMTFEGARTAYANRISAIELRSIRATTPTFGGLLSPGVFLTKLERDYAVFEDKPDFTLEATESVEFQEVTFASLLPGVGDWFWIALLCGWLLSRRFRRLRRDCAPSSA